MYANTSEPVVCPLIGLAWYIIAHPSIITGQGNLLEVHSQYERYNKIINEVVWNHWSEFEYLGISVEYFETHYRRKGAATFVATGCTVSPPMASIFLHGNCTLRGVKYRYIKYKKTGDHFVGRVVTGLPILKNSSQCPLLTPLFHHFKIIARRLKNRSS